MPQLLSSPQYLAVFTTDALTAAHLNQQGLKKAQFVGTPVMDNLHPTGKDLQLIPAVRTIALLPGSRLPEANRNLFLLLQLVKQIAALSAVPVQFRAALVPSLMPQLDDIAARSGWKHRSGKLIFPAFKSPVIPHKSGVEVLCHAHAFAAIMQHSSLVIGMTGQGERTSGRIGQTSHRSTGKLPRIYLYI